MGLLESLRNRGGLLGTVGQTLTDYQQLANAYPNASKFAEGLIKNLSAVAPPDPRNQQQSMQYAINRAFDVPGGFAGTFIGPKAATWNADAAAEAVKKLDSGIDPAQVWQEHLIGRMPDGALFSEIDDSSFKFNPSNTESWGIGKSAKQDYKARLNDAMELESSGIPANKIYKITGMIKKGDSWEDMGGVYGSDNTVMHPKLAENYGGDNLQFRKMEVLKDMGALGNYDPSFNAALKSDGLSGRIDYSPAADKSVALHELQHAIQEREGWARGGSPESFRHEYDMNQRIIDYHRKKFHELKSSIKESPEYQKLSLARNAAIDQGDSNLAIEYSNKIGKLIDDTGANNHYDIWKKTESELIQPIDSYRRLAGEAQARATQDRMNMSMDERRNNYPLARGLLSDIPLDQLINRYGDNGPNMAIDVWHGSPHKFDAFDMSKIGTGEGAQAYGHGLYFAENPEVAQQYADNVQLPKSFTADDYKSLVQYKRQQRLGNDLSQEDKAAFEQLNAKKQAYEQAVNSQNNLYKTSLQWPDAAREAADPLGPQHFLDWDKPLSESMGRVKNALSDKTFYNLGIDATGKDAYTGKELSVADFAKFMQNQYGDRGSAKLAEAGIPGIRYLDGGSRSAGDGSYNYVVFDDKIPRILERNGIGLLNSLKR